MIESLICTSEMKKPEDGFSVSASSSNGTLSQRRIEFHPARKAFTGFSNGDGDFHIETLNPSSDSQRSAAQKAVALVSTGKKSKAGDFFENGLDPELISGTTLRRIGAGLANLGNTCYLNSVVQCLTYTEPFVAYLQNEKHQSSCRTAGFCAMCAIEDHVSRALQSSGRILAPKHLVMNLRCISRNFRIARQEDAHEYMVNLLESMHKCCLPSGVPSESPSAYEKSLVHRIFGGHLRSQVKCMQCSYCSNTFDPFLDLSLEIVKAGSLLKALHHFTAMEQLDGGERQYQCQCCKQKVRAYKQLTVHKAPYVLTIHLKRFGSHIPGSHISGHKIDKKVEFESTLDLKPFVSGAYEGELKYTLYGVLVHDGRTTHSGHYYCFVRTSSGMWYSLDDNEVFQVSEKTVLGQKAYMLFYVRDRRSLVPKKLVDGFHRENLVSNIIENKEWSNRMKDTFQNVLVEKRSCGMDYSGTAAQRDASGGSAANGPPVKESSVKPNGQIVPRLVVSKEHEMLLQKQNLSKNPVKGLPVSHPTNGHLEPKIMLQSVQSSVKGNSDIAAHSNDATVTPADEKVNGTESEDPRKEFSVSVATLSDHNFAETCTKKPITETFADKIDVMNDKEVNKAPVAVGHEKKFGKVNAIGVISPVVEPSDAHCLKTGKSGPNSTELGSMEKSGQSNKMIGHVQKEDLDHHHRWKVIKKKKKLQKSRVARMFLGSNLLFRTSMTHWKKKKHKRSKHLNVVLRGITQEDLLDGNCTSGHPEPSTSEKTVMLSLDSACERKKKSRSGKNKSNSTATEKNFGVAIGNFCTSNIDGNHRERIDQNSAELATNESPRKSVSLISSASSVGTREPNDSEDKKKALVRSELRSMLMRSVEETIAHWDGIELPTSQVLGSSSRPSTNIGYVADDWDEEYDRGKRKKVKSEKRSFTGPNPFQEVASMKTQLKKVKMDHTSSGNQPIRI